MVGGAFLVHSGGVPTKIGQRLRWRAHPRVANHPEPLEVAVQGAVPSLFSPVHHALPLSTATEADIAMHTATDSDTALTSGNSARPLGHSPGAGKLGRIGGCIPQACQLSAERLSEPLTFRFGQGAPRLCDCVEFLQHRMSSARSAGSVATSAVSCRAVSASSCQRCRRFAMRLPPTPASTPPRATAAPTSPPWSAAATGHSAMAETKAYAEVIPPCCMRCRHCDKRSVKAVFQGLRSECHIPTSQLLYVGPA